MTLEKLISNFELLGDWEERYGYLIDLGKKLPGLPDAEKTEDNRVHGCQAMVWMIMEPDPEHPGALRIRADSDAFIVRGLIAVLQLIFNGRTPDEILEGRRQVHPEPARPRPAPQPDAQERPLRDGRTHPQLWLAIKTQSGTVSGNLRSVCIQRIRHPHPRCGSLGRPGRHQGHSAQGRDRRTSRNRSAALTPSS